MLQVFISSVQKELAEERRAVKDFITSDPLLRHFISGVFLFEDIPAGDRKPDDIYLSEVEKRDIYLAILAISTAGRTRIGSRRLSLNLTTPQRLIVNASSS